MASNVVSGVLGWLRAGYPEGVPPKDYFPLLALLRRTLDAEDFADVLHEVRSQEDPVRSRDIREAIEKVTRAEPDEAEVRRVAAHLAAGGWPLSGGARRLAEEHDVGAPAPPAGGGVPESMPDGGGSPSASDAGFAGSPEAGGEAAAAGERPPGLLQRVLAWVREGYPAGVPATDFAPVLALLRRRLTEEEVAQVAAQLAADAGTSGDVDEIDARVAMSRLLNDLPSEADVARVSERLGELGASLG